MMEPSLLIKLRQVWRDHIDLLSLRPQTLPEQRRRGRLYFETVALHETIFRSVYRCRPDHFLRSIKRAIIFPDMIIRTRSLHRFDGLQ
jgi:hypothetical protein